MFKFIKWLKKPFLNRLIVYRKKISQLKKENKELKQKLAAAQVAARYFYGLYSICKDQSSHIQ